MIYVILILTSLAAAVTQAQFSPGCSFNDGQCMYTVQLGHQGQCDRSAVTSGGGECCGTMQSQMTGLTSDVNTLKSQVSTLVSELMTTKTNLTDVTDQVTEAERHAQQLEETLAQKEAELNSTQSQLSQLIGHTGDEIHSLRDTVGRLTTAINNCKGKLGSATANTNTLPDSSILPRDVAPVLFCDFEQQHACGFNKSATYGFQMGSGKQSDRTGPQEDHTMGSPHGHYMYMDAAAIGTRSSSSNAKTITMTSPTYSPGPGYCLRFWYNMYGRDVQQFNVYTKIDSGLGYPVFHRVGDGGQTWKMGEVDLDSEYTGRPFNLVFSATTTAYHGSYSYQHYRFDGDVALDDIYVYNVSCKNIALCPSGGVTRESGSDTYCYTFHVQPATWYEAASLCHQEGATAHLVSIESQAEQDFLVQAIKSDSALLAAGQNGFFTAGNDEITEHSFEWTATGALYRASYSNWKTGQPNNVGDDQDCLLMEYPDLDFKWGDVDCDESHPFICKRQYRTPVVAATTTAASAMVG